MGARIPPSAVVALWLAAAGPAASARSTRCWLDHGAVVAAASFGDIAGDFIVDLSRPRSALHDTRANLDGIDGGEATARLYLAGQRIEALTLPVVDLDAQTRPFDTSINGVIGWDVLGRYAVTLDLRAGRCRMTLASPGRVKRGLRLVIVDGAPAVSARIADDRSSRSGVFLIDTARAVSRIADSALSRPMPTGGASVRLRAVSIGGRLFEEVPAEPMAETPATSAIGTGVWTGALLVLDPVDRRMVVRFPRPTSQRPRASLPEVAEDRQASATKLRPGSNRPQAASSDQWPTFFQMER